MEEVGRMAEPNGTNGCNGRNTNNVPVPMDGRDAKGRFQPGNKCSPGNPLGRYHHELRMAVAEVATPERMREVVEKLLTLSVDGDTTAARVLLDLCFGSRKEGILLAVESDGPARIVFRVVSNVDEG
jgi:hypothetical protein